MNALASGIHEKNTSFKKPKTVTTASIELETFPPQLCSSYTPSSLCTTEYFVSGTEPTEKSKRFATLDSPTNGSYESNGTAITLKWDSIPTPEAINSNYLTEYFNKYYDNYASKYYNNRISYNYSNIGTLGYEIYLKNNGSENYIGYTNSNSFVYNATTGGEFEFVVKSAYSIFKANKSSGLTIKAKTIDTNVNNLVEDNSNTTNTN